MLNNAKSTLFLGLLHAYQFFEKLVEVKVLFAEQPKPAVKGAVALRRYEKGQLLLVPLSSTIFVAAKVPPSGTQIPSIPGIPDNQCAYVVPKLEFPLSVATPGKAKAT
eukprot:172721-Pyramimonas_sp.AAC.1